MSFPGDCRIVVKVPEGSQRMSENISETAYQVVVNDEEQYSIWPADRELPAGCAVWA